jgi:transposase
MNNINLLGVDIAKNVFQLHGVDAQGNTMLKTRLSREKFVQFIANLQSCTIAMEACGGANHWARKFTSFGHTVKLISPQFVKPFVKGNKTDRNDAEAICESASRPNMRFVSAKTVEHQDMQALHRIRNLLVQQRTAIANQIRGLLMEYGLIIPQGIHNINKRLPDILEDATNELSFTGRRFLFDLTEQLNERTKKINEYEELIKNIFKESKDCKKIEKLEGVGLLTATALISCIGDIKTFNNGRHLSAYLGLVPKQYSSGNKQMMQGISKRGNVYIRSLLIHGARSAVRAATNREDAKSKWIFSLVERRGKNKAAVALANKTVRTIWAMLANDTEYKKAV